MASKSAVHTFGEQVAEKCGYKPGSSMEAVVSRLGGRVEYTSPFSLDPDNAIKVRSRGDFTIFVSSVTSSVRDRFTIAHELGHFFLHFPTFEQENPGLEMVATRSVDPSDPSQQRTEWEANWFAAGFLMPTTVFRNTFSSGGISRCASYFDVSLSAAKVRANSLGLT